MEQLVDDVGVGDGHGLADLRARVEPRQQTGDADEPHQVLGIPCLACEAAVVGSPQLLVGIVDARAEVRLLGSGELPLEHGAHTLPYDARAVVEDVDEGLVLAMDVTHEVLGALGQVEDGLEVDDLGEDGLRGGEVSGEERQVALLRAGQGAGPMH